MSFFQVLKNLFLKRFSLVKKIAQNIEKFAEIESKIKIKVWIRKLYIYILQLYDISLSVDDNIP